MVWICVAVLAVIAGAFVWQTRQPSVLTDEEMRDEVNIW